MLVILALLIGLVTVAERGPRPATESPSFSETTMQADISMKVSYASQRWSSLMLGTGFGPSQKSLREQQRHLAITSYLEATQENPTSITIRKLIIIQEPKGKAGAIARLSALVGKRKSLSPEVAMWQAIYLSNAPINRTQLDVYESRIRSLNLGWYRYLALADLYDRAGLKEEAAKERSDAATSAVHTVIMFGVLILIMGTAGLIGLILLTIFVASLSSGQIRIQDTGIPEPARSFVAGYLLESFVVYLAATIGIQLIAAGVLIAVPEIDKPKIAVPLTFGVYIGAGLVAFLYLRYRLRKVGWSWQTIGLTSRNPGRDILWGIGGYAACLPLILIAGLLSRLMERYVQTPSNPVVPLFMEATTPFERVLLFLLVSVAAPFFEETFFRGTLFHSFRAQWGVRLGIIASAVGFALVHPLPLNFLPILVLGTVFAVMVNQRGSLLPSMIAHCLNNTFSFILLLILTGS